MTPWLSIVGIGEDGLEGLSPAGRALLDRATVVVGGARHLAMVPADGRERRAWPSPLEPLLDEIVTRRGEAICVLASGDPFLYGIGNTLVRRVPAEEMAVVPAPSAFSLAACRLGWPLAEIDTLSLHGRPPELLHAWIQPRARLLILTGDGGGPAAVAGLLTRRGYGPSQMTVLERIGGARERRRDGIAATWPAGPTAALNTVAVTCIAKPGIVALPRLAGLPDDAFRHDGQLTKREVRAVTLAMLAPGPDQRLWDVGAGCGSVAIEWLRSHRSCRAVAIESKPQRIALIAENASALGCPGLSIVGGNAPAALEGLPEPDAVFIGGGLGSAGLIERCWAALRPGGRLVANAVTLEGEQVLFDHLGRFGGSLSRLAVARAEPLGPHLAWRPLIPVTQYTATKS
ncbi:MAG: precorrin-6y C5,15-methyltransferase (decarboxylating) subunit CbiE [Azospirillum sp.]|nr:precorrin-6y C5,15-methyltransferase (decarboxylating) subunit CbiE [Azospirillum sp.]